MKPSDVPDIVRQSGGILQINNQAIDIFSGNIKPYVTELIKCQLSEQAAQQALNRNVPINILPKIIDKLTNIYQTSVIRTPSTDREQDKNLIGYYEKSSRMNVKMNCTNELYNLCNASLLQPYVYNGKPQLRAIQNNHFIVYSDNPIDPTIPTHVILVYTRKTKSGPEQYYWVYSDTEIYAVDAQGRVATDIMMEAGMYDEFGNITGANPIGKIPFIYASASEYSLTPMPDEDGLTICKLLPVMLTDLNLAAMFQCFSILYIINGDQSGLKFSPNALWEIKQNPNSEKAPEIGSIKPTVDYAQVINLVATELSTWLWTRGIRGGTVGQLSADNFASGISKIIDEMDTFEARQKQVSAFQKVENDYWNLIINNMHPYWISTGQIEQVGSFTPGCEVSTAFAVQLPLQSRGAVVKDLAEEVKSGFISRKRAISKLNPELSDKEVDDLISEIDEENSIDVAEDQGGNPGDADETTAGGPGGFDN